MLRAVLTFEARCKSRLLARLESGEQVGLMVERGRLLRDGDRVRVPDGREIAIVAAVESLLEVRSQDPLLLAKAAYHLGNRHVAVQIMSGGLRILADHVLAQMLAGLGLTSVPVIAAFDPEGGAYGTQHAHAGEMGLLQPKIHVFRAP
jgi:urease accessory protein